ncbi:exosome complex component RRP43-like [Oscarella lobularis]|uniref:exosome complex component RRP43-like n=1 Tax=Oscarella lobularis TaxID=121494 RepID=UPI0033138550
MDFRSLNPAENLKKYVSKGKRPDDRDFFTSRPISVNVGSITTAYGSSVVKVGNSVVVCGIKGEFCLPTGENFDRGYVVPNVEFSPVCSPVCYPSATCEQAHVVTAILVDLLKSSNLVNLEELCIVKDKLAWVLYCDLVCLDDSGSILDVSVIALLAALANVRLPYAYIDAETELGRIRSDKEGSKLTLGCFPVATTFGIFDSDILMDPDYTEEAACDSFITYLCDLTGKLYGCHKPGGSPFPVSSLQQLIDASTRRANSIKQLIDSVESGNKLNN